MTHFLFQVKHRDTFSIRIVPAQEEHLPEIAALAVVVWRAHYPGIISLAQIDYMLGKMYDIDIMRQELARGIRYDRLLVDGKIKAFASYGPYTPGKEMKLYKLYVHPEWHRKGLGRQLLSHVEEVSREHGFPLLILNVNKDNRKAILAYRKSGFSIREPAVVDIGGGFLMDDYVMVKALTL